MIVRGRLGNLFGVEVYYESDGYPADIWRYVTCFGNLRMTHGCCGTVV